MVCPHFIMIIQKKRENSICNKNSFIFRERNKEIIVEFLPLSNLCEIFTLRTHVG